MTITDISPLKSGAQVVNAALRDASAKTGIGFDVLYNIARRESSFDPAAKAKTSSAAGLFQFIEQTWLGAVKDYGAAHGMATEAAAVTKGADGRYRVADPEQRKDILDMRFDAGKASSLAAELAQSNAEKLEKRLGRAVAQVEIYAAHFLGVAGAVKLLEAPSDAKAADLLPTAAKANRPVFYDGGEKRTVGEVVASIAKSMNAAAPRPDAPAGDQPSLGELRWADLFPAAQDRSVYRAMAGGGGVSDASTLTPFTLSILQALDPTRVVSGEKGKRA